MTAKKASAAIHVALRDAQLSLVRSALDFAALILIFPLSALVGWAFYQSEILADYAGTARHFDDLQWIVAYAVSGFVSMAVGYYLIQWPISLWLRIKAALSDDADQARYLRWRWYLGVGAYPKMREDSRKPTVLLYMVHAAMYSLRFYGFFTLAVFVGFILVGPNFLRYGMHDLSNVLFVIATGAVEAAKVLM